MAQTNGIKGLEPAQKMEDNNGGSKGLLYERDHA